MLLDDCYAASTGIPAGRIKLAVLAATGWLCGMVTAFCDPVVFLGLVAAHISR